VAAWAAAWAAACAAVLPMVPRWQRPHRSLSRRAHTRHERMPPSTRLQRSRRCARSTGGRPSAHRPRPSLFTRLGSNLACETCWWFTSTAPHPRSGPAHEGPEEAGECAGRGPARMEPEQAPPLACLACVSARKGKRPKHAASTQSRNARAVTRDHVFHMTVSAPALSSCLHGPLATARRLSSALGRTA